MNRPTDSLAMHNLNSAVLFPGSMYFNADYGIKIDIFKRVLM